MSEERKAAAVTARQVRRLQTLWGLLCKELPPASKNREARLAWVGAKIGREIGSFRELTLPEAKRAIEEMQKLLPPMPSRRPGKERARSYGTAGRAGFGSKELRMADAQTWALINTLLAKLGWTRERLDAFIRSAKSPTRGKLIRTLDDANRVIWALKGMLRQAAKERGSSAA